MTELRPPAEATVAILTALALTASWAVVASTDTSRAKDELVPESARVAHAAPAPGLVSVASAAPSPRRVVVRRRSRAS